MGRSGRLADRAAQREGVDVGSQRLPSVSVRVDAMRCERARMTCLHSRARDEWRRIEWAAQRGSAEQSSAGRSGCCRWLVRPLLSVGFPSPPPCVVLSSPLPPHHLLLCSCSNSLCDRRAQPSGANGMAARRRGGHRQKGPAKLFCLFRMAACGDPQKAPPDPLQLCSALCSLLAAMRLTAMMLRSDEEVINICGCCCVRHSA